MQVLFELAAQTNSLPLPEFTDRHGLRLPHEDDCLTAQAYHYVPRQALEDSAMIDQGPAGSSLPAAPAPVRSTKLGNDQPAPFQGLSFARRPAAAGLKEQWREEGDEAEPMEAEGGGGAAASHAQGVPLTAQEPTTEQPEDDTEWI